MQAEYATVGAPVAKDNFRAIAQALEARLLAANTIADQAAAEATQIARQLNDTLNSDAVIIANLQSEFRTHTQQAEATLTFVRTAAQEQLRAADAAAQQAATLQQQQSSELCDHMLAECENQTKELQRQLRSESAAKAQVQAQLQSQVVAAHLALEESTASTATQAILVQHLRRQVDSQNEQLRRIERLLGAAAASANAAA